MTDLTAICVTSSAETALKKLKRANIPVYNCKKDGASFIFSVKDKHIKKVFAIFVKPCYNIRIQGVSRRTGFLNAAILRIGLIVGAVIFAAVTFVSDLFVFKIDVSGSGSYLSPEVKRIVYRAGVKEFSFYSGFDAPAATGEILSLPQVTFCNIEKRGSVLHIDVQVDEEHSGSANRSSLIADTDGVLKNIVAICGTPQVQAGQSIKKGDTLISAYVVTGEERADCLAVGYAEIEYAGKAEFLAEAESEENLKAALSSVILQGDEILTRTYTVNPTDGGVLYVIDFTCLHKLSINME